MPRLGGTRCRILNLYISHSPLPKRLTHPVNVCVLHLPAGIPCRGPAIPDSLPIRRSAAVRPPRFRAVRVSTRESFLRGYSLDSSARRVPAISCGSGDVPCSGPALGAPHATGRVERPSRPDACCGRAVRPPQRRRGLPARNGGDLRRGGRTPAVAGQTSPSAPALSAPRLSGRTAPGRGPRGGGPTASGVTDRESGAPDALCR
jgi:hypothetical protein